MILEDDGSTTPSSVTEFLSVPLALIVFAFMSLFIAGVGLMLFAPFVAPDLVLYLIALWSTGRTMPAPWPRRAAVGLSPLIPMLVFLGADWTRLELSMLAGSAITEHVGGACPGRRCDRGGRVADGCGGRCVGF